MAAAEKERTLEETATWSVAVVCFVLVLISIIFEQTFHVIGKWLSRKHKRALYEALEKVKAELMLMGFISLMLTVLQGPISNICISRSVANTWHPCTNYKASKQGDESSEEDGSRRRLLQFAQDFSYSTRRSLATKGYDKCTEKGKIAFVTAYGIHQLHVFIFVLAVFHILFCVVTLVLGRTKMRRWRAWEDETKTIEYQYSNDPERFRFARETSFGRRHLSFWSKSPVSLWVVCFFRQFFGSVTKVDYLTLRHGFIRAHLAPGSEARFDFQKYIQRSLDEDFKVVVGITPLLWLIGVLFLLTNTNGWHSNYWLPFIPLLITLLVGTKLQVIITKMGLRILERGDVVQGTPLVQLGDELFWFGSPWFILFLIHVVFFQNSFQLAFWVWSTYQFGIRNCFHRETEDVVIRVTMGVIVQVLCSYVTLPQYALVTQMGSTMKPTIFDERVATALKKWHRSARKHVKDGRQSGSTTPMSSMPTTPTRRGTSPVHLLQNYPTSSEAYQASPRSPRTSTDSFDSTQHHEVGDSVHDHVEDDLGAEHHIDIYSAEFSFAKDRN